MLSVLSESVIDNIHVLTAGRLWYGISQAQPRLERYELLIKNRLDLVDLLLRRLAQRLNEDVEFVEIVLLGVVVTYPLLVSEQTVEPITGNNVPVPRCDVIALAASDSDHSR
jgi:hypothetical protein